MMLVYDRCGTGMASRYMFVTRRAMSKERVWMQVQIEMQV